MKRDSPVFCVMAEDCLKPLYWTPFAALKSGVRGCLLLHFHETSRPAAHRQRNRVRRSDPACQQFEWRLSLGPWGYSIGGIARNQVLEPTMPLTDTAIKQAKPDDKPFKHPNAITCCVAQDRRRPSGFQLCEAGVELVRPIDGEISRSMVFLLADGCLLHHLVAIGNPAT